MGLKQVFKHRVIRMLLVLSILYCIVFTVFIFGDDSENKDRLLYEKSTGRTYVLSTDGNKKLYVKIEVINGHEVLVKDN